MDLKVKIIFEISLSIAMLLFFSKDVTILHELLIYVHWFI